MSEGSVLAEDRKVATKKGPKRAFGKPCAK